MDHEPPETQSDENDEEIFLITVDRLYCPQSEEVFT